MTIVSVLLLVLASSLSCSAAAAALPVTDRVPIADLAISELITRQMVRRDKAFLNILSVCAGI